MFGCPNPTPCPGTTPNPVLRPTKPHRCYIGPRPPLPVGTASVSYGDDTSNLEYTTEMQAAARNLQPRRPVRCTSTFNPSTDIFDDDARRSQICTNESDRRQERHTLRERPRRSSILLQPPQRIPVLAAPAASKKGSASARETIAANPRRKPVSEIIAERDEAIYEAPESKSNVRADWEHLRKNARRRTIYVPSEDTTIMTIHPGAPSHRFDTAVALRSPDLGLDLMTVSEEETDDLKSVLKKSRASRKSLHAAPRRVPLQHTSRSVQSVTFLDDQTGSGNGKENIPPGKHSYRAGQTPIVVENISEQVGVEFVRTRKASKTSTQVKDPGNTKTTIGKKRVLSDNEHASRAGPKSLKARAGSTATGRIAVNSSSSAIGTRHRALHLGSVAQRQSKSLDRAPLEMSMPLVSPVDKAQAGCKYPVLSENLSRPELYEENWLYHQEIAISQLLNCIFHNAGSDILQYPLEKDIKQDFITIYNDSKFVAVQKKLIGSLQFGALSLPKEVIKKTHRLKDDLGMRRKFLNIWLESYELNALQTGLETVIGRRIPSDKLMSDTENLHRRHRYQRKALEDFIDIFLIRNEDSVKLNNAVGSIAGLARAADRQTEEFGSQAWLWRRTVLRSLMLILLLDKVKISHVFKPCMFQFTSTNKSSLSVLQTLGTLLMPSIGDITRPLNHLGYSVQSAQYPLEEYNYRVENLATDLRDGVLLTRLVELLLYRPASLFTMENNNVTIMLPTGEQLTTIFDLAKVNQRTWVLSHHLKFPCLGRTQKLYNVQVALSSLEGVKGIGSKLVRGVTADEIVDGHREKTIGLLWGLLGRCGLEHLVNSAELAKEISRLRDSFKDDSDSTSYSEEEHTDIGRKPGSSLKKHTRLLQKWASTIGRLHHVRVCNLTTAFTDSRAFEAIMDEYLPYFHPSRYSSTSLTGTTFAAKLSSIGCSRAFISLFADSSTVASLMPTRHFTVSTLAFLASRLLPLVRSTRAAITIQRAYRCRLAKREMSKRLALMQLASHCALVVRTRDRVVSAAIVLQRAWRLVLQRRIQALVDDVVHVQSIARAWRFRNRMTRGGKRDRVRGGW